MAKAGRPLKYETPEEMQMVIDDYFGSVTYTDDNGLTHCRPTMSGLAIALGFKSRQSLVNYSERDQFLDTIKAARLKVQEALEDRLYESSPTGVIFNLKNNFDWKDKQEYDHTSGGKRIKNNYTVLPVTTNGRDTDSDNG